MSAVSTKQIKNRIKSIRSTMQITRAMQLVSASRIKKMTKQLDMTKPYFTMLVNILDEIAADKAARSSLYARKKSGNDCHIVIAGDRGLAGGYNNNLFKSLLLSDNDLILPIGKKAYEYFSEAKLLKSPAEKAAEITMEDCKALADDLIRRFEKGEISNLYISYTEFKNMLFQEPKTMRLLPLAPKEVSVSNAEKRGLTIYEPDTDISLSYIVPYCLSGIIYGAAIESVTSETAARRNAMETATDNASEMIDRLTLDYNRARQAAVTQELTEITSGVENI